MLTFRDFIGIIPCVASGVSIYKLLEVILDVIDNKFTKD